MNAIITTIQNAMIRAGTPINVDLIVMITTEGGTYLQVEGDMPDLGLFNEFALEHFEAELEWVDHAPAEDGLPAVDYYAIR